MRAEVIALGLVPQPAETAALSEDLAEMGLELGSFTHVITREREVEEAVRQALKRSHLIIITGGRPKGLMPLPGSERDDLAKKTLSRLLDRRLILQGDLLKKIEKAYRARNIETPSAFEKMALLPQGAKAVEDPAGIPAGFYMEHAGRCIMYLPGLPEDFGKAVPEELAVLLSGRGRARRWERSRALRTCGLEEAKVREALSGIGGRDTAIEICSSLEGVDVKLKVRAGSQEKAESLIEEICAQAAARLGDYCYGAGTEGIENAVARLLTGKKLTIATAESCTGGLVAKRLTDVSGSSAYMERGVVTYSNLSKHELLGVSNKTLQEHGAVSKETAQEMAEGVRWNAKTDLGLSITGIAGPTGGTLTKQVGLVYIGLATPEGVTVKGYNFPGDREAVRFAASQKALDIVRRYLLS